MRVKTILLEGSNLDNVFFLFFSVGEGREGLHWSEIPLTPIMAKH